MTIRLVAEKDSNYPRHEVVPLGKRIDVLTEGNALGLESIQECRNPERVESFGR